MEAELTRHFINNVAEEPDHPPSTCPPPYMSAPPSYSNSISSSMNSGPTSISSTSGIPTTTSSASSSSAASMSTATGQVGGSGNATISGVLHAQEESVHVLQQKLKEVTQTINQFLYIFWFMIISWLNSCFQMLFFKILYSTTLKEKLVRCQIVSSKCIKWQLLYMFLAWSSLVLIF